MTWRRRAGRRGGGRWSVQARRGTHEEAESQRVGLFLIVEAEADDVEDPQGEGRRGRKVGELVRRRVLQGGRLACGGYGKLALRPQSRAGDHSAVAVVLLSGQVSR